MSFYVFTALTALIGAVVSMIIGYIWYGPLFGKKWMHVMEIKKPSAEEMKEMRNKMALSYLANFLVAYVQFFALGFFAAILGGLTVLGSLLYAVFIWLGFVMPIQAGASIWSGKSKKAGWTMFGIGAGYQLIILIVGSLVWALMYANIG